VAQTEFLQTSFLSGVLDPRAKGRIDTEAYAQGLLVGVNIEPVHLGGVRRRRGTYLKDRLPYRLTRKTSGITITAPNGGTTGNANDDNESTLVVTTTPVGTTNPYVVVQYDLGSAQAVHAADAVNIFSSGGASTEFRIQHSNDASAWTDFGTAFEAIDTFSRSYRRSNTDIHAATVARYWRIAKVGGTSMGSVTISLGGLNLFTQTALISNVRLFNVEVSADDRYVVAVTDRSGTVYDDTGALVQRLPLPYANDDIPILDAANSAEVMAVVHENYPPRFILQELAGTFQTEAIVFDAVPEHDYADDDSPAPVSDVQRITFAGTWAQGNTFQVELEGARTASIVFAGDTSADEQAATAESIAREVQKLYTVEAFEGVTCARTGALQYTITFAGASARNYRLASVVVLSASSSTATATVAKVANGSPRSEPVWSDTRGYPRTVAFFEQRLYFGGTRSRQQTLFGSRVNSILDFEISEGLASDPLSITLDGASAIQGLFGGRTLEVFTTTGEYRYVKPQGEPVTPGDSPKAQTFNGSARIRPVNVDGSTLFVQRKMKSIRDYKFNYEEDAYDSLGVSSLAPHLIYAVKDIAAYTGSRVDEINLVLVVNGTNSSTESDAFPTGSIAVLNTRKESRMQAWTIWTTQGEYRAVATSFEDMFFAVKRTVNNTDWLMFEIASPDTFLDGSLDATVSGTTISGLGNYDGQALRVRADGFVLPNVTPTGGSATLDNTYSSVTVGFGFNPQVVPMPLAPVSPSGTTIGKKRRVVSVDVMVRNTLGLRMNGRVLPERQIDVMNLDQAATPFSGVHHIEETGNWDRTKDKLIVFDQVDPLPMEILLVTVRMESA
jgi:hypothetical protein